MTRVRNAVLLGGFAVVAVIAAGVAVLDPFNLRYAPWWIGGTVALALILVTFALVTILPLRILRIFVGILGLSLTAAWAVTVLVLANLSGPVAEDVRELAEDGGRRAVLTNNEHSAFDTGYAVVVRSGSGPFEQQSLVWSGVRAAPEPDGAEFVAGSVRITAGTCAFEVPVEPVTLEAVPILRGAGELAC